MTTLYAVYSYANTLIQEGDDPDWQWYGLHTVFTLRERAEEFVAKQAGHFKPHMQHFSQEEQDLMVKKGLADRKDVYRDDLHGIGPVTFAHGHMIIPIEEGTGFQFKLRLDEAFSRAVGQEIKEPKRY